MGAASLFDVEAFVGDLRARRAGPHIAINGAVSKAGKVGKTALVLRQAQQPSRVGSPSVQGVPRWIEAPAGLRKVELRGKDKVEALFTFAAAAHNLVRLPKLLAGAVA